jgi:SAM-dependent methyltransferase
MRTIVRKNAHAEFDNYAQHYSALLADPIRDRFADGDFFYRRKLMLIHEFFCRFGLNAKQSCWVDIGCGQGDLLRLGRAEFGLSTGCDVSSAMLRGCEGLTVVRQEQDDVLPFPDGFADFATAVCVYHHVSLSKRAALTLEAARVLKPGGTFCIIEHNPVNPVTRMVVRRSPVDMDARLLGIQETRRLLEERQFRIVWERYFLFLPEPLYRRIGFIESWLGWLPLGGQYAVFARAA